MIVNNGRMVSDGQSLRLFSGDDGWLIITMHVRDPGEPDLWFTCLDRPDVVWLRDALNDWLEG